MQFDDFPVAQDMVARDILAVVDVGGPPCPGTLEVVGQFAVDMECQISNGRSPADFCLLQDLTYIEGVGNLIADPDFADPNNGDFHLLPGSPAINAGDPNFVVPSGAVDLDGQPRIMDGRIDIGVDEISECLNNNLGNYAEWVQFGRPDCWCYEYNCRGDANGTKEGTIKSGYKSVYLMDLMILSNAYNRPEPPIGQGIANLIIDGIPAICADFARDQEGSTKTGFKRVYLHDLNILSTSYNVNDPTKGPGLPICPLATAGGDIVYYKYPE